MDRRDPVTDFYKEQLPEAELKNNILTAQCPFCEQYGRTERVLCLFSSSRKAISTVTFAV